MTAFTAASSAATIEHRRVVASTSCAVVLVQLGTPEAPNTSAVRRYLKEFLSDPRVVEIPRFIWQLILRGIILNLRPAKSAAKYAAIWTQQGSPLLVHSREQEGLVTQHFASLGVNCHVVLAMRYCGGQKSLSLPNALRQLRSKGVEHFLVVPMYPQYAGATAASVFDAVFQEFKTWRNVPALRTIKHFHDHSFYINALAKSIRAHWEKNGRGDKLVLSFHGVPQRSLEQGDPYHCECHKTGRLLAQALELSPQQYVVCFQSRFGKAKWLQPYTAATVAQLGREGIKKLDVVCPGFVVDCLETLEEVAMELKHDFEAAGGGEFRYIPCLNDSPAFSTGLAQLLKENLQAWPISTESKVSDHDRLGLEREQAARALGANA